MNNAATLSSFSLGIAILGALTLAILIGWTLWTSRRDTPRQATPRVAGPLTPDVERREPTLGPPAAADGAGETGPVDGLDRALDADNGMDGDAVTDAGPAGPVSGGFDESMPAPRAPVERRMSLDALIDAIASVSVDHPVSGDAALAAMPPTRRVGSKPFAIEGLNEASGHWELPVAGLRYRSFQAGVQLANRTGALNDIEYSEFALKTQNFADAIGGAAELPEMRHEVARARELDHFAGGHDAQLGFTLRAAAAAWSVGYVQQNAARLGFVAGAIPGRMVLPSSTPGMPPVLSLSFDARSATTDDPAQAAIREVSLGIDVPQVPRSEQPLDRLRDIARLLAEAMDGTLCDDDGRPIEAAALDAIGADLEVLHQALESRDLATGTPQARRLFS